MPRNSPKTNRARELRKSETRAEKLLWSLLRARQLCGLKFRRQHPVGPFYLDLACQEQMVSVELDGEYHEDVLEKDLERQRYLENLGWTVVRFTNDDVLKDPEAVARSVAKQMGIPYEFRKRNGKGSGSERVKKPR